MESTGEALCSDIGKWATKGQGSAWQAWLGRGRLGAARLGDKGAVSVRYSECEARLRGILQFLVAEGDLSVELSEMDIELIATEVAGFVSDRFGLDPD